MALDAVQRAKHVKETILLIRQSLSDRTLKSLFADPLDWAGYQPLLLIVREAARHLPDSWKAEFGPDLNWRQIADLANQLRHVYHDVNPSMLWSIYENDLDPLEAAIDRMIAAHGPRQL